MCPFLCPQCVDDGDNGPAAAWERLGEKTSGRVTQLVDHIDEKRRLTAAVTAAHPVVVGGAQGGITHFGSRYWGKSLTL